MAYNIAAPNDDSFLAGYRDVAAFENLNDPGWGAGNQARALGRKEADIHGMEPIHILCGVNGHQNFLGVHLWRQRKLDQDPVDFVAPVQIIDQAEQFGGRNRVRRRVLLAVNAQFLATLDLAAHINLRGRIVAHQYNREPGAQSGAGQGFHLGGYFGPDFRSDLIAVQNDGSHEPSPEWIKEPRILS